jgi:hypothetical protein
MPSKSDSIHEPGKAEAAFRAAFERLKLNTPNILPIGSIVTQNNIAREAGVDPSALKKNRFPFLIEEIQNWLISHKQLPPLSQRQQKISHRSKLRSIRQKLEAVIIQRDHALSLLASADMLIIDLTRENTRLKKQVPNATIIPLKDPERIID